MNHVGNGRQPHAAIIGLGFIAGLHLDALRRIGVDVVGLSDEARALLATVKIPLVETDLVAPGSDIPGRLQVEHLVAHGHEGLGYLTTSEPTLQRFATPPVRKASWRRARISDRRSLGSLRFQEVWG